MAKSEDVIEDTFSQYPFAVRTSGKRIVLTLIPDGEVNTKANHTMDPRDARNVAASLVRAANQLDPKAPRKKRGGVRTETT